MSAAKTQCVEVDGREYTVYFGEDGKPRTVCVHVKRDGITVAMRRITLSGYIALAAIAKATGSSNVAA